MSIVQAWLVIGLPALLLGLAMFVGRSPWRTAVGYVVLLAGFVALLFFDRIGAALLGAVIVLLLAAGRGGRKERVRELKYPGRDIPFRVGTDRTLDPPKSGSAPAPG